MVWRSWWSRLRRLPAPVVDAALALGLAVAVTIAIRVAPLQGAGRAPGAYSLGLAVAALVLFRRRWPLGVLLGSAAALTGGVLPSEWARRRDEWLAHVVPATS